MAKIQHDMQSQKCWIYGLKLDLNTQTNHVIIKEYNKTKWIRLTLSI
jgi:hypothetical protein